MVVGDIIEGVDLVVIGAGTGGYVAAIRAAQLGIPVTLIEHQLIGGVCLNWGCIPSKALIHVAGLKKQIEHAAKIGVMTSSPEINLDQLMNWKTGIVDKLKNGINTLLKNHKIDVIHGRAFFADQQKIVVEHEHGRRSIQFKNAIIATGSSPIELPELKRDGHIIINSTDALDLQKIPEAMVIIGAGSIGLELGIMYANLGTKITMIDRLPTLLPYCDSEIAPVILKSLSNHGIRVILGATITHLERQEAGVKISFSKNGQTEIIETEKVLVAVGRQPNSRDIGLERAGVKVDHSGYILVDEKLKTSTPAIYAIGDVVSGPLLAHKASYQGKIAAEVISGLPSSFKNVQIPNVIYSDPEIATVGLSEDEAKSRNIKVKTGKFPFSALGRTMTLAQEGHGFVKIVSDANTGIVLGMHIVGPSASDLIAEGVLAVETRAHIDDLTLTVHAHPTLAEGIEEAAEQVERKAIHIFNQIKTNTPNPLNKESGVLQP